MLVKLEQNGCATLHTDLPLRPTRCSGSAVGPQLKKHRMELKSLIDQPSKLPTIPKVTQALIESFSSEDATVHDIGEQIATDPALSAKLLRLANSAFFHVSRTIGTVEDALRMLGFVMVRNLVLGNGMVAAFRNTPGLNMAQFWRYNLNTACASRWLAHQADQNGDMAFTLGLLHSIGQLQMHAVNPADMAVLDKKCHVLSSTRAEEETRMQGYHYGDVSAELAKLWNFPPALTDALRTIPSPQDAKAFSEISAIVHLGAWAARMEALECTDEEILASYPKALAKRAGIDAGCFPTLNEGDAAPMPHFKELTAGLDAMLE
jgi:HD-like signal output (HDOD) protein